jgi:hypothetical protein
MDDQSKGLTQRWVAYGFMNMVSDALEFFAAHANWKDFFRGQARPVRSSHKAFRGQSARTHGNDDTQVRRGTPGKEAGEGG